MQNDMANNADISDMQKDILEGCKSVMDEVNTTVWTQP